MDVTAHKAPSQQAVRLPLTKLEGMEVWMNRHKIEKGDLSFHQEDDKTIPQLKHYPYL